MKMKMKKKNNQNIYRIMSTQQLSFKDSSIHMHKINELNATQK